MSESFVADASLAIAWTVLSQSSDIADRLLHADNSGAAFVVPVLWPFEVVNALLVLKRRKKISIDEWMEARQKLSQFTPVIDEDATALAFSRTSDLAEEQGLTL